MNYVHDSGYVYVDVHSEEQVEKALKKNKDYIGEKSIQSLLIYFAVWVWNDERQGRVKMRDILRHWSSLFQCVA